MSGTQLWFSWNPGLDSWHTVLVDKMAKNEMFLHILAEEEEHIDSGALGLRNAKIWCSMFTI